jgi:hypothetical protein
VPVGLAGRQRIVLGRRARDALSLLPLAVGFVIGEWCVLTGTGSFADLTALLGVIVGSLLAGLLPVLLFASSRGKGECAFAVRRGVLRHAVLLGSVYVFFLAALFAHGLVIWEQPIPRIGALVAGVTMLVFPVVLARTGAFGHRLTIEVCDDQHTGVARFALLSSARPVVGGVSLHYRGGQQHPSGTTGQIPAFDALTRVEFEIRPDGTAPPDEVKVWVHRVTPEGETESLQATAVVHVGTTAHHADLSLSHGETVVAAAAPDIDVAVVFKESDSHPS